VTYHDHNDAKGRAHRQMVESYNDERARMLRTFAEFDSGTITLCMSKADMCAVRAAVARMQFTKGARPYRMGYEAFPRHSRTWPN